MIPSITGADVDVIEYKTKTFDVNNSTLFVDGIDAVKQAAFMILNTERYRYPIYSWNYGIEYKDLTGISKSLLYPELERRITEALLQDNRIKSVSSFEFESKKSVIKVQFIINSIYGDFDSEVIVNV